MSFSRNVSRDVCGVVVLGLGDQFEYGNAFGVPGTSLHSWLRPGPVCSSVRLILGVKHHDSEALLAVGTTKPLATDESCLPCGPRDDVLAEMPVDLFAPAGV